MLALLYRDISSRLLSPLRAVLIPLRAALIPPCEVLHQLALQCHSLSSANPSLLIPLNICRHKENYLTWKCDDERHAYEKCQYDE